MINDSMKSNKLVGMIQPKNPKETTKDYAPQLHEVGCMGKITSFKETDDSRFIIELKGIIRFKIVNEIKSNKKYRECEVDFTNYYEDLENKKEEIKFSDLELIFKDLKSLFEKRGFIINWGALEKQSLDETINALAMASPFTIEEKQVLLEAKNLNSRKTKIAEILTTYSFDQYNNTTVQ
jgi:Lon protease-like protein